MNHPATTGGTNVATEPKIDLHIKGHGYFTCYAWEVDRQIMLRLPASVMMLRAAYSDRTGIDVSDVDTVTELLVMFADIDNYAR